MKAPDKIYLFPYENTGEHDLGVTFCGTAFRECIESKIRPCYIRKDLLLEWAKELKHVYELPISSSGKVGRISLAKAEVLQLIIDKLNSL